MISKIKVEGNWDDAVHVLLMLLAVLLQIKKQVALIADCLVVGQMVEHLPMRRAVVLELGSCLLPTKIEDGVV